ncbi:MAG: response regulator [Verrucomicrobiota bacterium]
MQNSAYKNSPYRVVIVDDDVTEREILVELLSAPNRQIEAFESAELALEYLQDNPVDLAFLDHVMPGLSGADLADKIKELHPSARIVMCTGYLVEVSHPQLRVQAERVLHKPLNLGEVLQLANAPALA